MDFSYLLPVIIGLLVIVAGLYAIVRLSGRRLPDADEETAHRRLRNTVRLFSLILLAVGLVSLPLTAFTDLFGVTLVAAGALSFLFSDEPAILTVHAVVVLFAVVNRLWWLVYYRAQTVQPQWIAYLVVVIGLLAAAIRNCVVVQPSVRDAPDGRAGRLFPWLGLGLCVFALIANLAAYWLYAAQYASGGDLAGISGVYNLVNLVTTDAAVLGLGLSLAALAAGFPDPVASWIGLLGSGARLVLWGVAILSALNSLA